MHITISVGGKREIELPDFGNLEATCEIHFEVDHHLLETAPESFLQSVKNACTACQQAVEDELARQPPSGPGDDAGNFSADQARPTSSAASHSGSNANGADG